MALTLNPDPARAVLKAQWKGSTALADFGDPLTASAFGLCLYDPNGALVAAVSTPPGGLCPKGTATTACWGQKANGKGFAYADNALTPEGVQKVTLTPEKPGAANGSLKMGGKGPLLPLPPAQSPTAYLTAGAANAVMQFHRLDSDTTRQCWTATLRAEKKNLPTAYQAKCSGAVTPCAP